MVCTDFVHGGGSSSLKVALQVSVFDSALFRPQTCPSLTLHLSYVVTPAKVYIVGIAIAAFWVLPNFPRTTSWLTQEERELAIWRLEEDIGADDWVDSQHQSFVVGLKLAFSDIKTYVLMVLLFGIGKSRYHLALVKLTDSKSGWRDCHQLLPVSLLIHDKRQ